MRMRPSAGVPITPLLLCLTAWGAGCVTPPTRTVTIVARPDDAAISIDGRERGKGPIVETFTFDTPGREYVVSAERKGYAYQEARITAGSAEPRVELEMKPLRRRVTFTVVPVAAEVKVDGESLGPYPVGEISTELEFPPDESGAPASHTVTAERPGYRPARQVVRWTDPQQAYELTLEPPRKDVVVVTTDPPGADVFIGGEYRGTTDVDNPVAYENLAFEVDPETDQVLPYELEVRMAGYDPVKTMIAWDAQEKYHVTLEPRAKVVRVVTVPGDATVTVEGVGELTRDESGAATAKLAFPPVNGRGELKAYTATVSKPTPDADWEPKRFTIAWDDDTPTHTVKLERATTRAVALLRAKPLRGEAGWTVAAQSLTTTATRDEGEPAPRPGPAEPVNVLRVPDGSVIDSLAVSPDGTQLLSALLRKDGGRLRSRLVLAPTDPAAADADGAQRFLTDGQSLDLTPSFTPDGSRVVFASDRGGGGRMSIWAQRVEGRGVDAADANRLTNTPGVDLWPSIDAGPRPRLFYQSAAGRGPGPRLFVRLLAAEAPATTAITAAGATQPRVGPRGDAVVYAAAVQRRGDDPSDKRDLFRIADDGGAPVNLTATPDVDEFDPAWSPDGRRIAYACDRGGVGTLTNQPNYDIWVWDAAAPEEPRRITSNESWDDNPAWDATGRAIYFRSNRGGRWGVWRVAVDAAR